MNYDGSNEPDRVDWLDLGPDPDEGARPRDPRRRYLWYGAAAGLVALTLVLTRTQQGANRAAPAPGSTARTAASPSAPVSSAPSSPGSFVDPTASATFVDPDSFGDPTAAASDGLSSAPPLGPPKVTSLGHPLLNVPADWELFGQGSGVVVRIQLALGRITTTTVPQTNSDVSVVFLVGSDRAFIRPMDDTPGYVVRDGKRPAELPQTLQHGFTMLPGPDLRHVWTNQLEGDPSGLELVDLDGRSTGVKINVPNGAAVQGADGAGYALLGGIGGVYEARPGKVHRVTSGAMLASGPTRLLAVECDDSLSCANVVIDRATGARRTLGTPVESIGGTSGTISPDGNTAILQRQDGTSESGLRLLDLNTGADTPIQATPSTVGTPLGPQSVWSPDSRWVFVLDAAGRVIVVNRGTRQATVLGTRLAPVTQLALRHSTR